MKRFQTHASTILLGGAALLYFLPLGLRALWDSDEGRYAEIGREMLVLKEWVSPHLNYVLYFEKPPLMYWLIALSERVFGLNAFGARFWCATFAVLTIALTSALGKRWRNPRVGLLAGAILGTSVLFVALSQFLVLDMALTFWTTLELYAFSRLLGEPPAASLRRYTLMAALGAAGGMLTKGPVAIVLPAVALFLTLFVTRTSSLVRKLPWLTAAVVFGVIAAPWFIWVSVRHPFFVRFFFIREHVARFFTTVHQRNQPFYFFGLTLVLGFLPWSAFLPRALGPWLARRGGALKREPIAALLMIWSGLIFVFFSASHSKLVGYILPIFPALAVLLGDAFDGAMGTVPAPPWVSRGLIALVFFFSAGLVLLKWPSPPAFLTEEPGSRLIAQSGYLTLALGVGVFILVGAWGMRRTDFCMGGVLLAHMLLLLSTLTLLQELDPFLSAKGIATTVGERALPKDSLVAYGVSYENHLQSLLFYTRRRLIVMGEPGELAMGQSHAPEAAQWFVPEGSASRALLASAPDTWVVTDDPHWKALENGGQGDHFAVIERQGPLLLLQKIE